jgi:hypothetical protein
VRRNSYRLLECSGRKDLLIFGNARGGMPPMLSVRTIAGMINAAKLKGTKLIIR